MCVVAREGLLQDVQIAEHGFGFPLSEYFYYVAFNAANEHFHGFACAEGARGYLLQAKSNSFPNVVDAGADCVHEIFALEDLALCVVVVACNRELCGGASES